MKKIYSMILALSIFGSAHAQDTAMDFTQDDCNGNPVHLFSLLDEGDVVIIEFFMTNCQPCINAGNAIMPVFNDLNTQYPDKMHWFHFGYTNSYSCSTVAAWVEDHGYPSQPFNNGADQVAYYGGFGMPTVVVVAGPNHDIIFTAIGWSSGDQNDIEDAVNDFFATKVEDTSSVSQLELDAVYNGLTQSIVIDFNSNFSDEITLEVFTADGQLALQTQVINVSAGSNAHVLNAASLASGVYIIKANSAGQSVTQRLNISK